MVAELAPFAFLALVLAGFGVLIRHMVVLKRRLEQRGDELEIAVAPSGYFPSPARDRVAAELAGEPRFEGRRLELASLFAREGATGVRYILDYTVRRSSARSSVERGTAFGVRLSSRRLPRFVFRHSSVEMPGLVEAGLDKLVSVRYPGFKRVPLDTVSPEVAHSLFYAEDRDRGVQLLTAAVIGALSSTEGWGLESTGSWLIAERDGRSRTKAPEVASVVDWLGDFEILADAFEL